MQQRRNAGKSHWYHETQSSTLLHDVQPLAPEAAQVSDPLLLDVMPDEDALKPFHRWLAPARALAAELFPAALMVCRMQTFTAYERLSTALTVAQVCGVQRLCSYYSARLTPLPGPGPSRESNHRLAQITQYARQLASSPSIINARSRQHLLDVGLTFSDCIIINQIIGFVGFQARVVAAFQAAREQPVRWLPGLTMQDYADASLFSNTSSDWRACYEAPFPTEQQDVHHAELRPLATMLNLHPASLSQLSALFSNIPTPHRQITALLTARINGSVACFNAQAHSTPEYVSVIAALRLGENEINQWAERHPVERAIVQAVQCLTRTPERFSTTQLSPLREQGISSTQVINLLAWCGLCGWLNRLKIALGEAY